MKTRDMSVTEEMSVKEKIWDYRQETDKLLREATRALADKTHTLAVTTTMDGDLYYAGAANVLSMPEFYDYQLTNSLFTALERFDFWTEVLSRATDPLDILMGEEFMSRGELSQCSFIYHRFTTPHVNGTIGVVGPSRLNYPYVVPVVRYMGDLITELGANW